MARGGNSRSAIGAFGALLARHFCAMARAMTRRKPSGAAIGAAKNFYAPTTLIVIHRLSNTLKTKITPHKCITEMKISIVF